jgi:3-oxoadipate enol-lactonase
MHVDVEGPEDGAPLVLLHGGIGTGRYHWSKQVRGLVAAGYRLHLPDLPGHGSTPVGEGPYTRDLHVDAVEALLRAMAAEGSARPVVAGFSMGGHTLMALVERLGAAAADLLAGLVLVGVSVRDHPGLHGWRARFDPDVLEATYPLWVKQLAKIHAPLGGPDAWRDVCRRDAGGLQVDVDLGAMAPLEVPTLLVRGDRDETVDPAQTAELRAIWPHAGECVLPYGGHDVQLTRSTLFQPVLLDFLQHEALQVRD